MATIYKIQIEQTGGGTGSSRGGSRSGSGRKKKISGKASALNGGGRGGVEHNRKMRAVNPVLNKATSGAYEKSMRLGRAGLGVLSSGSSVGVAIIISFVLQQLMKMQNKYIQIANSENTQNYKRLENGMSAIHGAYEVSEHLLTGKITYNQNK